MAKTTKKVQGIHSLIKFQRHQGVESLTIEGKQELADLKQDNKGDTSLILNADKDKVNEIASNVPYLGIAHTTTGEAPNQTKTATVSQDLTQFPLTGGELVTVDKTAEGLTLNDTKVKELIDTKAEALKKELGSGAVSGTGATASPITLNGGELVKVDKSGDTLTLNDSKVKELVETTKTEILEKVEPTKPLIKPYNLSNIDGNISNATLGISMDTLSFGAFTITTQTGSKVESYTYFLHQGVASIYKKTGENIIVFINCSQFGANVEIYFKNPVDSVYVSGINAYQNEDSQLNVNIASSNYNEMQANMAENITTSGNVPQPFDEGYDHL